MTSPTLPAGIENPYVNTMAISSATVRAPRKLPTKTTLQCFRMTRGVMPGRLSNQASGVSVHTAVSRRSEEHTSELHSLMRISYAECSLKKKQKPEYNHTE